MDTEDDSSPNTKMNAGIYSCRQCGQCCQGEATVSLSESDSVRMVRFLGLPGEVVQSRYWRVQGPSIQMKTKDSRCIFYNQQGCSIHQGKPGRCRQWPLHPSILLDEANFITIRDSCPGINRAIGYKDFCDWMRQLLADKDDKIPGDRR